MKHSRRPFLSYRIGILLTGMTLVFIGGAIAGLQLAPPSAGPSEGGIFTDLKTAVVPDALAGFNTTLARAFDNYATWPTSVARKANDSIPSVFPLISQAWNSRTSTTNQIDVNGDGLTDLLYHYAYQSNYPYYFGVFLNKATSSTTSPTNVLTSLSPMSLITTATALIPAARSICC